MVTGKRSGQVQVRERRTLSCNRISCFSEKYKPQISLMHTCLTHYTQN